MEETLYMYIVYYRVCMHMYVYVYIRMCCYQYRKHVPAVVCVSTLKVEGVQLIMSSQDVN